MQEVTIPLFWSQANAPSIGQTIKMLDSVFWGGTYLLQHSL